MNLLTNYRTKPQGFPDLLNYAALIHPGVILGKNGALIAGFYFKGEDLAAATDERRNLVSIRLNNTFARLGTGVATWVEAARIPAPGYSEEEASHFPDPVSRHLDNVRREMFLEDDRYFETTQLLIVQYKPPTEKSERVKGFLFGAPDAAGKIEEENGDRHVKEFEKILATIEDGLGDVLRLQRMSSYTVEDLTGRTLTQDDLLNYLNFTLTNRTDPVNTPPGGMYLDTTIGSHEIRNERDSLKVGNQYVEVVSIDGYPAMSWPGILHGLNNMAVSYRAVFRFLHLDQHRALSELNAVKRRWESGRRGFVAQLIDSQKASINRDAALMAAEAEGAVNDENSGLMTHGFATPVIVIMDEDLNRAKRHARWVATNIQKMGFNTRVEGYGRMDAWMGSLPGHVEANLRRPLTSSFNWADLLPITAIWPGEETNPCDFYPPASPALFYAATDGHTPFRGNLHVGDVGHSVVIGPTGAGKSVLLAFLASQFRRYQNGRVVAFDKGGSLMTLCLATGGRYYNLQPGDVRSPKFCPLQRLNEPGEIAWVQGWISRCFELQAKRAPTPAERGLILEQLKLTAKRTDGRSLSNFVGSLRGVSQEVAAALDYYTMSGPIGEMLDAEDDEFGSENFSLVEVEHLMTLGQEALGPVLDYMFHRVESELDGRPTLIILDEAWAMLQHPMFLDKVAEWFRVFRKRNAAVVLATQSLDELRASGLAQLIQESCLTRFFLSNENATTRGNDAVPGPRELYEAFGLNDAQIQTVAAGRKKQHYLHVSPLGSRQIWFNFSPTELAFYGVSSDDDKRRVNQLRDMHGDRWPNVWLAERGCPPVPDLETENGAIRYAA